MAIDPERRVRAGDRLQIPAATYNSLIEMLRAYKRNKFHVGAGNPKSSVDPHNTIFVENATGQDLTEAFKVLRLSHIVTSLQDDPYAFAQRPVMFGYVPQTKDDAICITLRPALAELGSVASGGSVSGGESGIFADIIPAVVSGVTVALVKLTDLTHEWANPTPGVVDYLTSDASSGQARILYWESLDGSSIEFLGSGSGADEVVIAVILLFGRMPQSKPLYLADLCTLNNDSLSSAEYSGYNPVSFTHHIGAGGGYTPTNHTTVWSEDDTTGFTLTIPANSGELEVEGICSFRLHIEDTGNPPAYGPSQCRFAIYLSVIDMNHTSDETPTIPILVGIVPGGGTIAYAYLAEGAAASTGESANNSTWNVTVPFHMRLPDKTFDMRLAYKTYTTFITDTVAGVRDMTVTTAVRGWSKGFCKLTAKGL